MYIPSALWLSPVRRSRFLLSLLFSLIAISPSRREPHRQIFCKLFPLDLGPVSVPQNEIRILMILDKLLQLLISDSEILRCFVESQRILLPPREFLFFCVCHVLYLRNHSEDNPPMSQAKERGRILTWRQKNRYRFLHSGSCSSIFTLKCNINSIRFHNQVRKIFATKRNVTISYVRDKRS